jgi:hypothetical protein
MSSSYLPPSHPDQPEEIIEALPSDIPDEDVDKPREDLVIQVGRSSGGYHLADFSPDLVLMAS